MNFGNRGREGRYYGSRDQDDHQDNSSHSPASFAVPPSSSSTSSSSPTNWMEAAPEDQPSSSCAADHDPPPIPASEVEKEHMFDKVVTPSDVGKLNRLVIPKQHAEKYFPLDSSANEKGLLLNFEDRNGKPWRFRYSYWNSSQSYVMTKGWSRFVKEKRLDAGDTVSFGRGVGEAYRDRLFIDWKRRPENQIPPNIPRFPLPNSYSQMMSFARSGVQWGRLYTPSPSPVPVYDQRHHHSGYSYNVASPHLYPRSGVGMPSNLGMQFYGSSSGVDAGSERSPIVFDSVPVGRTSLTSSKRVRLFGVNLDTPPSAGDPSRPSVVPQVRPISPLLSLQLSLGDGSGTATAESPDTQDKQSMSLDLDV